MKIQHIVILLALFFFCPALSAQNTHKPDTSKPRNIRFEMAQARMKFNNDNYPGALKMYEGMMKTNPNDITLNFRLGECYFVIDRFEDAIPPLEKCAEAGNDDFDMLDFYLARSYQKNQQFEKAKKHYEKHLNTLSEEEAETDPASVYLNKVNNAVRLMDKKVDVDISNMGKTINSKYVDANPSITADETVLIFTSRRPESSKTLRDPVTGEYFDNIYISHKQKDGTWSEANPIPGEINTTDAYEASSSISPDGKTIFIYMNINGITQSGDIYVSHKNNEGTWTKPQPLREKSPSGFFKKIGHGFDILFHGEKSINSSYFETSACITADNNSLYFISERMKKGLGQGDVWVTHKIGHGWSVPRNLGKNINTVDDEISVFIHPDGNTMFYASNGKHSMGGYDILMSKKKDGKWSDPVNMGYPINTPYDEFHFALSADGNTAYISSNRESSMGKSDVYSIDMKKYFDDMDFGFKQPKLTVVKGNIIDEDKNPIATEIDISDAKTGNHVTTIMSDENGEYFITLSKGKDYVLLINHKDMEPIAKTISIPEKEQANNTKTWHFILNKK
ncbi:MAG: hypothetical protein U9Q98_05980 [Bacteroidota bacterium]|nr:hypothetical protein [Bacteroidota bacterium]